MVEQERSGPPDTDEIPAQPTAAPTPTGGRAADAAPTRTRPTTRPATAPQVGGPTGTAPQSTGAPVSDAPVTAPAVAGLRGGRSKEFGQVRRTRFSGLWVGATIAAVVLLVLLVFIIQNSQQAAISFFGAHGHLPLGVALLLAAICGVLLVAVPGYGRIIQLRRALKRSTTVPPTPPQAARAPRREETGRDVG